MNDPQEFLRRAVLQGLVPYEELWPNTASRGTFVASLNRFPDVDDFISHWNNEQQIQFRNRVAILTNFIDAATCTPSDNGNIAILQRRLWYRSNEIRSFHVEFIKLINHLNGRAVIDEYTDVITRPVHIIRYLDILYSRELPRKGRRDLPYVMDDKQKRDYDIYMRCYNLSEPYTDNESSSDEYSEGDDMDESEEEASTYDYESEAEFTDDEESSE